LGLSETKTDISSRDMLIRDGINLYFKERSIRFPEILLWNYYTFRYFTNEIKIVKKITEFMDVIQRPEF
jgi:hypothetical protein